MKKEMKTKTAFPILLPLLFFFVSSGIAIGRSMMEPSDQSDVRAAVQSIFDQLKAGQYEAIYVSLPSYSLSRVARRRFAPALQRSRNLYQLDRYQVCEPCVDGNLAAVD